MAIRRFLMLVAVAVLAHLSTAAPSLAWGALAVADNYAYGYSYNYPNQNAARRRALAQCGRGCRIVANIRNACASFAVDASRNGFGPMGWGVGTSRAASDGYAISYCRRHGGRACVLRAWVCD